MLQNNEHFVQQSINEAGGLPSIDEAIGLIESYLSTEYSYQSKNDRLAQWEPDRGEIYELVLGIFTVALSNISLTYQSICGMLAGRIPMKDHIDQIKTIAEIIAIVGQTDLIDIVKSGSGQYIMVTTSFELEDIPEPDKHEIMTEQPHPVVANRDEILGTMILGGRANYHNNEICLDHINRMNAIELKLNRAFLRKYEEAPTFALDTVEKENQWNKFIATSYRKYIRLVRGGNRFYLGHRYDKRGRSYAEGYHVNTQGSSFKKAIVQLAKAEIVEV